MKTFTRSRWFALILASSTACVGAAPDVDEAATSSDALSCAPGTPLFSGCSAAQQAQITAAWNTLIAPQACGTTLRRCLTEARFSPASEAFSEEVVRRLTSASPTTFYCHTSVLTTYAEPHAGTGEGVDLHFWPASPPARIAAETLGALAALHGYKRIGASTSPEHSHAVRSQVRECSLQLSNGATPALPNGRARYTGAEHETELQPFGDSGPTSGSPFLAECPTGYVTMSVSMAAGASGITGFRQTCTADNGSTVLGPVVGTGPFSTSTSCGENGVAVGVRAIADAQKAWRFVLMCRRFTLPSSTPSPAGPLPDAASTGATNPSIVERVCPPGMYLSALGGQLGPTLRNLRVWCRDQRTFPSPQAWHELDPMDFIPSSNTLPRVLEERCTERGGISGLYGLTTSSVIRLGATCRGYRTGAGYVDALAHTLQATGDESATNAVDFQGSCPAGQVATGIAARTEGSLLRALRLTCGQVSGGHIVAEAWSSVTGDWTSTSGQVFRHCAPGEQLAGLRVSDSWYRTTTGPTRLINRILPFCRPIATN